ncbi:hypothetical protein [Pandoraea horticolens]|nr:hypothetical protein [Pandoraea horticolens]
MRQSNVVAAVLMVASALVLLFASVMNMAWSAETTDSAATSQQTLGGRMTSQQGKNPGGLIPCSSASSPTAQKKATPGVLGSDHDVVFYNCSGSYSLDVTQADAKCMIDAGDSHFTVPVGTAYKMRLSDNNVGDNCSNRQKNVLWYVRPSGGYNSNVAWRHGQNGGAKTTMFDVSTQGVPGAPWAAVCDGMRCLNYWVTETSEIPLDRISFQ